MNKILLNTGVQDYIKNNLKADIVSVALKKSPFPGVKPSEIAQQLAGLQKVQKKLPAWFESQGIYYPPVLNLEQCSSEQTAMYKAGLASGNTLLDLTGGFGVDSYFFSRRLGQVHYCELDPNLAEIAAHNFAQLGAGNIAVHAQSGLEVLEHLLKAGNRPDWIYADPSRRNARGSRVVLLEDYQPNIPAHVDRLLASTNNLLLDTSPMLDLAAGSRSLRHSREIHVVAIDNEVRELLWWLQPRYDGRIVGEDVLNSVIAFFVAFIVSVGIVSVSLR